MKRLTTLFFLSTVAVIAMDGDEKDLTAKPKMRWTDSIEDSITEFVQQEELKVIQDRIAKRQSAILKKESDARRDTRVMLADLRKQEIAFQVSDPDSLARLVASTSVPGFIVGKVQRKRPQTGYRPTRIGDKK